MLRLVLDVAAGGERSQSPNCACGFASLRSAKERKRVKNRGRMLLIQHKLAQRCAQGMNDFEKERIQAMSD